jgi:hypothetical protein
MFSSRFFKIIILSSCLPFFLFSATWTHTQVATAPISTRPVIAADSLGYLHIAWTADDPYGETLRFATNQSGIWTQKQIAGGPSNTAYNPSIITDKYGFTYIVGRFYSYYFNIRYFTDAYQTDNYWSQATPMGNAHYHESSIEVDSQGNTHVFAQEDTWGSNVFYQVHDLNNVVIEGGTSQFFATAIDPDDVLHFVGSHSNGIWYTYNEGSGWRDPDSIDQIDIPAYHPSIACDRNGHLHVIFASADGIYYINNISGDWSTPELTGSVGIFPNIAVDENAKAHVVFYSSVENGGLFYINNVNGTWSTASEHITTINTDASPATEDVAHVKSKIALGLKDNTVNIVYIKNNNQVMLAQTKDYNLRNDDTDTTATLTSLDDPATLDTLSAATQGTLNFLHFSISDHSGDGLPLILKEIVFQAGPAMSDDLAFNDIFSELTLDCSDGSSTACSIYAHKIIAGTPGANWKSINENESLDFTLKGTLRSGLTNVDNKTFQIKINGLHDVMTDPSGSQFSLSSSDVVSDTIMFHIVPDHFDFLYLGNDFYNENLVIGWSMLVRMVDINGNVATGVSEDVTLSAVELDGVTPTSLPLQSTQSLTKTMINGVASWGNITFPETGRIRILASCDLLSGSSDTVTVMPYAPTLLITSNDSISKVLNDLGIDHDYYHEGNYQFPTVSKITGYDNLLLFPSLEYSWYVDSTKIKYFLDAGTDTSRKNILTFGENALGYFKGSPFAKKYFGATISNSFYQDGSGLSGTANDPITNDIDLSLSAGNITEVDTGYATMILSENSTGKIVGCRMDDPVYRTVLITPEFNSLIPDGNPDSLLTRVIAWFNTYETTGQPPVLSDIPDILMKEDSVLHIPLSGWNSYVNDPDTPIDQLHWATGTPAHVTVSLLDDTLTFIPQANYFGTDSVIVTVSDGEFEDRDTVRIMIEAVNDTPYVFDQTWPLDGSTIADTSNLLFSWQPSVDIDGDMLDYEVHFYAPGFDTIFTLTDSVQLPLNDLMFFPADTLINWSVSVSDPAGASVMAGNAPLSLTIERTEVSIGNMVPVSFVFLPNYPNPFNPSTILRFGLPTSEHVHIIVYNTRGRKVTDLLNEDMDAGYHELKWQAGSLSSGIYIIRIHAGSEMGIRKVLLLK